MSPSTHNVNVPSVHRAEYSLVDIANGYLHLMTTDGTSKDDVKVPEGEDGKKITEDFEAGKDLLVTITSAMGEAVYVSFKEV